MKAITILFSLLLALSSPISIAQDEQLTPEQEQYIAWAQGIWESLNRQQGEISLLDDAVTLNVPDNFYYLSPKDAEKVLVEVWGNPPGSGLGGQGMLFPSEFTPFDEGSWAVTIGYEQEGYVSDEDADSIDYDEMLAQMKAGTAEENEQRVAQGFAAIELVGWASTPFYDQASHKLHWAQELRFEGQDPNTLNYNVRVLGRKGVLVLNFVADMTQKALIDSQLDTVVAMADFDTGSRYQDFDPSIDQVAAYGIGALVAGKIAAKVGLFAVALVFLKKFGVLIVIGAGALIAAAFKRKRNRA